MHTRLPTPRPHLRQSTPNKRDVNVNGTGLTAPDSDALLSASSCAQGFVLKALCSLVNPEAFALHACHFHRASCGESARAR